MRVRPAQPTQTPDNFSLDAAPTLEIGWSVDLASPSMSQAMRARLAPAKVTPEGFVELEGWAARAGVQAYPERPVGQRAQYRPPEEVSSADSLASWKGKALTVRHPQQRGDVAPILSPDNWSEHAGGVVLDASWDAELGHVKVKILAQSQEAIDALTSPTGPRQLSAGYLRTLDLTPGATADGVAYDSVQRNIQINHLALVDLARAGDTARVGLDSKGKPMEFVEVIINGRRVRVAKEDAAVVQAEADALTKAQADADAKAEAQAAKVRDAEAKLAEADAKRIAAEADAKAFRDAQTKEEGKALRAQLKDLLPGVSVGDVDNAGLKRALVLGAYPEMDGLSAEALLAVYPKAVERLKADRGRAASELGGAPSPQNDAGDDDPVVLRRKVLEAQANAWKRT